MVYKEHQDLKFKLIYKIISAFVRIHLCKSFITHSEIKIVWQQYQWISGSVLSDGVGFCSHELVPDIVFDGDTSISWNREILLTYISLLTNR